MIKRFLIISFAIALSGCGKAPVLDVGEFAPYVERFERASLESGSAVKVDNLIIRFGSMETPTERGICEISGDETPRIRVDQTSWDKMSEEEREALLFHEMGHCVLHRKHRKEYAKSGVPASLMNPYMLDADIYKENQDYYHNELFSHRGDF